MLKDLRPLGRAFCVALIIASTVGWTGVDRMAIKMAKSKTLLVPANIVGPVDGRIQVHDLDAIPELGLGTAEIARFRATSGYVYCPGDAKLQNGILTSGFLVERSDLVVTNAHAFIDQDGQARGAIGDCFFQTQTEPFIRRKFSARDGDFEIGSSWKVSLARDYAVMKLESPVPGAQPFKIRRTGDALKVGTQMLVVSAYQNRPSAPFDKRSPIVQSCEAFRYYLPLYEQTSLLMGDCDLSPGASGAAHLVREKGEWIAVAIVTHVGPAIHDGFPYSEDFETSSYSKGVAIDGRLREAILRFAP